jgi:Reverse transcriptase (RNA-dependent DNA polymerase)
MIVTPFGKFRYKRLHMGIKCSPDFAQEGMESILSDLSQCDVYIDDVGVFSNSFDDHLQHLAQVLQRLQENGEWAVQETDWLGYWLTPVGLKPWQKKIKAFKALQPPTTFKELQSFIRAVNFYMMFLLSFVLLIQCYIIGTYAKHQNLHRAVEEWI